MTVEQLKRMIGAQPFRPFNMRLAGDSQVEIPHPEFVLPHPGSGRTVAIAVPDDAFVIVDLLLVAAIDVGNGKAKRRPKRR